MCVDDRGLSGSFLVKLSSLDDVLDHFLLRSSLLVASPPHWALVFAFQTKVTTGFATRLAFVALLASQSACEAACASS